MSRPQPRRLGRALAATLGLPALLLGSVTASAFTGTTAASNSAPAHQVVKHTRDDDRCNSIRFGATQASHSARFPRRFDLPAGFQPEGIAIDHSGTAYFGSRVDGDIYAADLRTGLGKVISQGPGTASLGMKADQRGRLFVAGAAGGNGRVIDTRSGKVLASYAFSTTTPTFVNDVILSKDAAWFTDSRQPLFYKVPLGRNGQLPSQAAIQTIPLTGDYKHDPMINNGNGISLTPDGRNLIIVQSATGFLFQVDPRTGVTKKIELGGAVMTNGDGLLLSGDTLYVVQNRLNKIAVLDLDQSGSSGRLVREIKSADFDVPTTAALFGSRLYLPNARFSTPPTPTTPYWVAAVDR
ncbi:SMP-30/gluconolactonase/LRE family protein [Kribbella catacumbae]|uniref:SMP-30/gluconolactonase/LRE family protein n=1 Tax=Kribbella catacumbae TaxID=460086 RepID=UPI00036D11DC|nr:SMP-30/gluconolactonase/LRE family protein [Kribbella catacumbae]